MINKIYKTRANNSVIPFSLGGFTFRAKFTDGDIANNVWATYITRNKLEQLAIEESPLFGTSVLLERLIDSESKAIETKDEDLPFPKKDINSITTMKELANYFVRKHGMKMKEFKSAKILKEKALSIGFPIENIKDWEE